MPFSVNPPRVWAPRGRGFSMGMIADAGCVMHFTGQVAWDADEQIVGLGDIEEQTRQCFRNIFAVLEAAGGLPEDLVAITTYYTVQAQLPAIQKVRAEMLTMAHPPASTSEMVAGLRHPDFLVELTPVAVIPEGRLILK
jgi:enamine deaminase RidA (YjgF/YER057c/UK114 family)